MDETLKNLIEEYRNFLKRYEELETLLLKKEVISNKNLYQKYAKEYTSLKEKVNLFKKFCRISEEIKKIESLLKEKDKDLHTLAKEELLRLNSEKERLISLLKEKLTFQKALLDKDVIVEIRAGTGGQEASLFAADLYRMYTRYAAKKGWIVEPISTHLTELGGIKEIVFSIKGKDVYERLKFESGVHRVQRIPQTETQGRIHTSTATVAVLQEPKEIELKIDPKDLKIDFFRASGPGGQHVNVTDSAVRITHLPSGLVVTCQDERSQLKNRQKALRVLRARLLDSLRKKELDKLSQERKSQIGMARRSEKVRTYNFPDHRVTDHRIGLTIHRLDDVLEGDLDLLIEPLLKRKNA